MAPAKAGKYEYRPVSLVRLRQQVGYTQTQMAQILGVPANTLSRWETGTTTPDAESLAAIYSVGVKNGVTPNFFQKRKAMPKTSKSRTRLVVLWDLRNWVALPGKVAQDDRVIRQQIRKVCPKASSQLYKAFVPSHQAWVTDTLQSLGWRVWDLDVEDVHDEIVQDARSDCGQEPEITTLLLITQAGDFDDLIRELGERNVDVHRIASKTLYPAQRFL